MSFEGSGRLPIAGEIWGVREDRTVLFLHGIGQTRYAWAKVAAHIVRAGWQCVLIDLRGHGESGWAADHDYSLKVMAGDCAAIVDQLGVAPVIVGASLGGMIAFYAQGMNPGPLTSGLVLVDISLRTNQAAADRIRRFMLSGFDGFDSLQRAASAIAEYRQSPRNGTADSPGLRRVLRERDGRWYWHWDPALVRQFTMTSDTGRMGELREAPLTTIDVPTLLLRGGQSDVTTDEGVIDLLRIAPKAEVVEIAGASHMIASDQNDAFGNAVLDFLDGRVRATPSV